MNDKFLPESNRLENKHHLTDSIEKEVTAFLNYSASGVIFIGIDDKTQLKVKDRLEITSAGRIPEEFTDSAPQVSDHAEKVLRFCMELRNRDEIKSFLGLKDREHFRREILNPLIKSGKLELTIPEKPISPNQKYVTVKLVEKGK